MGDLEKFCGSVQGPKEAEKCQNWIFPLLAAVLDETSTDRICLHGQCRPSEPCLHGVPCVPGAQDMAVLGDGGGHFAIWGAVLSVGTEPTKKHFGRNSAPPECFVEIFGSSEPRSRCATFLKGGFHGSN